MKKFVLAAFAALTLGVGAASAATTHANNNGSAVNETPAFNYDMVGG